MEVKSGESTVLNTTRKTATDRLRNVLRELLRKDFGEDVIVDGFVTRDLIAPGENYGSWMVEVTVTVRKNKSAVPEVVHAVAKMPPDKITQEIFNTQVTFLKEIAAYEEILPTYQQLQRENGVPNDKVFDILPKCYGTRKPGDPKTRNCDDAVILMENLKVSGYSCGKRVEGLDLAHSELAVRNLATFHALGIATKLQKPEVFTGFKHKATVFEYIRVDYVVESRKNMAMQSERLKPFYERISKALDVGFETMQKTAANHFGTICHSDFWVNNIMFHHDGKGNPDAVKFVDFQVYSYQSPVKDLLFFVMVCTEETVMLRNFDHLLNLYHQQFIKTLEEVNCDASAYGIAQFLSECKEWTPGVVLQCCIMVNFILLPQFDPKVNDPSSRSIDFIYNLDLEVYRERLTLMFQCFLERDWI